MVAIVVLALMVLFFAALFNSTTSVTGTSLTHLDADDQVRLFFGRVASDFSHMVRRPDLDYYVKSPTYPMTGNDQLAVYSEVAGYSDSTANDAENSVSLIAYRLNTSGTTPYIERMSKALSWNSGNTTGILPVVFEPITIATTWPTATNAAADADYETIVPNAFRLEYYYLLRSGTTSVTPWDPSVGSTGMNGFKDVAAIGVVIAITDRKTSLRVSTSALTALAAQMGDFTDGQAIGSLPVQWQTAVNSSSLAPTVQGGIRIYERVFSINPPSQ